MLILIADSINQQICQSAPGSEAFLLLPEVCLHITLESLAALRGSFPF